MQNRGAQDNFRLCRKPGEEVSTSGEASIAAADFVMFVGRNASKCLPAGAAWMARRVRAFVSVEHLIDFLRGFLQAGDLVLLKGSERADDLPRIVAAWNNGPLTLPPNRAEVQAKEFNVRHGSETCRPNGEVRP